MEVKLKKIFVLISLICFGFAENKDLVDCNKVFDERKGEISRDLVRLDDERRAFEAYKKATIELLEKREGKIKEKEDNVNDILNNIDKKQESIKKMLDTNQKLLKDMESVKKNKLTDTFSKMKASKAAPILDEMETSEAADILFSLDPKVLGTILAKMDSNKASLVSNLIKKGPPFKSDNERKFEEQFLDNKINNIPVKSFQE